MIREFPCVSCPLGCLLRVELKDGKIERIEGNRCPRGEAYAREEITDPKRVLATSVKVLGGDYPLVSVRTDRPIPKRLIPEIMEIVRGLCIKAPVEIGQVLVANLAGTGANLIATRRVLPRSEKAEELPRKKKA
jgi:CxxC motif-containing protein